MRQARAFGVGGDTHDRSHGIRKIARIAGDCTFSINAA
jgi:hypothetical protein